ncbi:hypothetical protein GCM10010517_67530 [Streptosporangium fragile]|uniref:Uncharacterized protein n=1 Tax=Streptosporangium fragile TaxID=46186 RepID=A0ABP6INS0_9ACTN
MQRILDLIERRRLALDETEFLRRMADPGITPARKLSFAPAMAPFVMAFADINKYVLRDETSSDPLQRIINTHTEEDDHHFGMFLQDLRVLGFDDAATFTERLEMLWGDGTARTRQVVYSLTGLIAPADPTMRLVIVEAVEAAGNRTFDKWRDVAEAFRAETGKQLYYFGEAHFDLESGHAMGTENIENDLAAIVLTEQQEKEARALVDKVFQGFIDMGEELLAHVDRQAQRV